MVDANKDGIHDDRGYDQPMQVSLYVAKSAARSAGFSSRFCRNVPAY